MIKPDSPEAHRALGKSYLDGGNAPRAIVEFKRALELKPGDGAARDLLARAVRCRTQRGSRRASLTCRTRR
jgi:Flp pilus assembly protein TadD